MDNTFKTLQVIHIGVVVATFLSHTRRILKALEVLNECLVLLNNKALGTIKERMYAMAAEENARAFELSTKSGLRQPSQGHKYLSITGKRPKFKWLGDCEELILFVDGYLKITATCSYTTNNGGFHTMKAEGDSISFYSGTKTLNVQGSRSEIIGQKLLQFAGTGSEEQSHFAASNIQTNFVSDDDHEQQGGGELRT